MAPEWITSGAFVNWPAPCCGGAAGIAAGATKLSMVRGLPASCTVKSVLFRSRTGAPSPLVTLTTRRTLSCAIAGSADNAQIVKQNRIARIFIRTNPPECSQTSGTRRPEEKECPQKYERSSGCKAGDGCACSLRQCRWRNSDEAHNQRPHPSQNGNPLSRYRLRECMAGRDNRAFLQWPYVSAGVGRKRYPTPRTVSRCWGCDGSFSMYLRNRTIKLSIARVSVSSRNPHTSSRIDLRETILPL